MLNNLKSKINEVEDKKKAKKAEKVKKKQEEKEAWLKKQDEIRMMLDKYYSKYRGFLDFLEYATFENLYEIYNGSMKYNEYFILCDMFKEIKDYDYENFGLLDINFDYKSVREELVNKIRNKYNNDDLMLKFYNETYYFKSLIPKYNISREFIKESAYNRFKLKLDEILWERYDTPEVKKVKFFYDLFSKEGRPIKVRISSHNGDVDGGEIEYKEKQSIYDFVFSDIKYCKLLDGINN